MDREVVRGEEVKRRIPEAGMQIAGNRILA